MVRIVPASRAAACASCQFIGVAKALAMEPTLGLRLRCCDGTTINAAERLKTGRVARVRADAVVANTRRCVTAAHGSCCGRRQTRGAKFATAVDGKMVQALGGGVRWRGGRRDQLAKGHLTRAPIGAVDELRRVAFEATEYGSFLADSGITRRGTVPEIGAQIYT